MPKVGRHDLFYFTVVGRERSVAVDKRRRDHYSASFAYLGIYQGRARRPHMYRLDTIGAISSRAVVAQMAWASALVC